MIDRYRKRPVVIEAMRFFHDDPDCMAAAIEWGCPIEMDNPGGGDLRPFVSTLEGAMEISDGDYLIKGIADEFYPCKSQIFLSTYEPADE